ncbi:NAD(P)-binding domain-containing protein [Mycobacterium lepromatosis]|nr:NAD(P)-binding domain-containing protein [Mycobacterium lepromatosis]
MVPTGEITTSVITEPADTLESDDIVIDGGNSCYCDDIKHVKILSKNGINLLS